MTEASSPGAVADEPVEDDLVGNEAIATARCRIRSRGDSVASAAAARAIRRLEASRGEAVDESERAAVNELATSLAAELLAVPLESLADAEEETVIETALELFGDRE